MRRFTRTIARFGNINLFRFRKEFVLMRSRPGDFDLYQRLRDREGRAITAGSTATNELYRALKRHDRITAEAQIERLKLLLEIVETTAEAQTLLTGTEKEHSAQRSETAKTVASTYVIGSWFLADCYRNLLANPHGHERLHFVTGIKLGPNRTLDRMVEVAIESQSAIHAVADPFAAQRILIQMDEWGHAVHGLFHSHPGQGPAATRPSSTDLGTHERYERGGYPLVGAIFVRDGYVRFFGGNHHFAIIVYGKGVHRVDDKLYKISNVSDPASQTDRERGSDRDGSPRAIVRVQPGKTR